MKRKQQRKTMLLLALLSCSAAVVGMSTWKAVAAADTADADRFALVNGASVRLKKGDSGIRFRVEMGSNIYDELTQLNGDVVAAKAGMFVVPYAFVNNANAYNGAVGEYETFKQKIDIVFYDSQAEMNQIYQDGDYYYANGAVVDMKFANLNLEYVGIGYIATTTETGTNYEFTTFTEKDNARSIAYVAGAVYADTEAGSTASKILENYVLGALLGELETVEVSYNEETDEYVYNTATYENAADVIETVEGTVAFALNATEKTMVPGASALLQANMGLTVGSESKVVETGAKFTSSDPETVSVSKTGEIKALKVGTATVTATTLGQTVTCAVKVEDNREEKALDAADYDLSKKAAFETTVDSEQELVNVTVGGMDVSEYATIEGTKVSVPYSVMKESKTGEVEVRIGTNDYVYTQTVTVATYVISDKKSFDAYFSAMKAAGLATHDYYVVMAKNAIIDLEGASYNNTATSSESKINGSFLGVFDGRGATLKNFTITGQGGLFGQVRWNIAATNNDDWYATLKNFALVNVTATTGNAGLLAYSVNGNDADISNIYIQGTITQSSSAVIRCNWGGSTMKNVIVNVDNTASVETPLFGQSGTGSKLDYVYGISNVTTLYSKTDKMTNCALYEKEADFFKNVTSLPTANGWSDVWSFDNKGNLCFGGNIVMTKPDTRVAKELGEAYYQVGGTEALTIKLDAGETVESITVGENNVTDVADKSVAGQVSVPAATVAALATGEYAVAISTENYKYEATFVYADLVISTPDGFTNFLTDNRTNSNTFEGKYIVLSTEINYSTSMTALFADSSNKTENKKFKGVLDGRGHAVSNLKVGYHVFSYFAGGAVLKDIAFIDLKATKGYSAFVHATSDGGDAGIHIENVFISINQAGSSGQNGFCANPYTTTTLRNVVIVSKTDGTNTAYGLGDTAYNRGKNYDVANTYLLGTTLSYNVDGGNSTKKPVSTFNTTVDTLLGTTTWLTADNGWNMDIWSINTDGNLCFGEYTVVSE